VNELLGFVALSLPILVPLGILVVGLLIAWAVVSQLCERKSKRNAWLIGIIVIILIPTLDVILGRIYFHTLCTVQGGAKIYKQVELSSEYWDEEGVPIYIYGQYPKYANRVRSELEEKFYARYQKRSKTTMRRPNFFNIEKDLTTVTDSQTKELLGTFTTIIYFGGWLVNTTAIGGASGTHCPNGTGLYVKLLQEIFVPSTNRVSARR